MPCQNLFNSNWPFTHEKIASSCVSSHPPPNKAPSLMLRIDTCELLHTNSYVVNQSYEFLFTTLYPLVSPHIRLQITKGCSKPEAYCSLPLGGPKYKEKKTREARLGLESMLRIIDPSPLPIPDRQSKMLPPSTSNI